jgi:hypothetical protein
MRPSERATSQRGTATAIAQHCPRLRSLEIGGSCVRREHLTLDGMVAIARSCRSIQQLRFYHNLWVDDIALTVLAPLLPHATHVCLNGTVVSDGGIATLVEQCTRLSHLELMNVHGITDDAIRGLARGCPRLQTLCLTCVPAHHRTQCTNTGLSWLPGRRP